MADLRSANPIRGAVADGASVIADLTHPPVMGSDGSNYRLLAVDATGQIETAHDVNTNPIFGHITDGADDLDVVDRGDVEDTGLLVFGSDGANVYPLKTDSNGVLVVDPSGETENETDFGSSVIVKDTPSTVHSVAGPVVIKRIVISGSGFFKADLQFGVTASEASIGVQFNSNANPNMVFEFPDGFDVASGETILVEGTNLEAAASPPSDFTAYVQFVTEV